MEEHVDPDRLDHDERERLRSKLVAELVAMGYEEPDAQFAVRLYFRETHGDVVIPDATTAEDYRAVGLDRDFLFRRGNE